MSRIKTLVCLAVASTLQALPGVSVAQDAAASQEYSETASRGVLLNAIRRAVVSNPEVQASWHGYRAATSAQDVARSGYLPTLDLNADVGRRWSKWPHHDKDSWNYRGAELDLNQMIYDGFATSSEVSRMGYRRLVSYYDLLEASENAGVEVIRAYADVERYRKQVDHAKANYATHKQIYDQINNRASAGVSRKVDLDQATGRLALAEANLLTEVSNLHDVSARYQRLVGELPPDAMPALADSFVNVRLPENIITALRTAYVNNPSFNAAIESVRASFANRDKARSGYHPRLDLHANTGIAYNSEDNDYTDYKGTGRDSRVELLFKLNLFRGGADHARVRQAGEEINQAQDLREKACRDLRQTLTIAFQNTKALNEKMAYLNKHRASSALTREAYRRQFDIGQRTLLDLLDSENEYFTSQRNYTDAQYDLLVAEAQTLAGTGELLHTLGVQREDLPTAKEAGQNRDTVDPADMCPADAPAPVEVDKPLLGGTAFR